MLKSSDMKEDHSERQLGDLSAGTERKGWANR